MIPDDLMGDIWPKAQPGPDDADYGSTRFSPLGRFPVRSFQSFTLVYTVGEFGLDDTGAIKIVGRWTSDGGGVQFTDPGAMNYVTATASNGVDLYLHAEPFPHQRPWYNGIRVTVKRGYMSPGDTITVILGDRSLGSPGFQLQTFCEAAFEFRVLADVCATGVFLPVSSHAIEIGPGPVTKWVLTAPTLRHAGDSFSLGIRGEDAWGNASDQTPSHLQVTGAGITGLPQSVALEPGARAARVDGLRAEAEGTYRLTLQDVEGAVLAVSNPLVVRSSGPRSFWGDLHGQSGETVGINPMRDYLQFARDVAFLDVTSHQANDFQLTNAFWQQINELTAEFNQNGSFVVFPGYEWSGNTPVGGDHNVFFASEGRQIRRSSHALLEDRSDIDTDANTLPELFAALKDEDCVLFAHVGGRPADISRAEDARLRTAVEVHSDWGTFEWIMTDAFELGYRVGLVCNSDGHKGAPGACYPGASEFGAYSGLTCFLADNLTREDVFGSLRRRHHYGTTGCRLHLEVTAHLGKCGGVFAIDPRLEMNEPVPSETAQMGDIVRTTGDHLDLSVLVEAPSPIERVDILNGAAIVRTLRPHDAEPDGRLRVVWQGAEYRGRGRTTRWRGKISFDQARIREMAKINSWNLEREFEIVSERSIAFDAVTTGNFGGCDIWLDRDEGTVSIKTDLVSSSLELSRITGDDTIIEAGGLDRKLRLFRLPRIMDRRNLQEDLTLQLNPGRDNPIWVRVVTEDGFVAWSSPIYVTR
ncbi:DUF3604 domain-containing protein [Lutimaribacter marinistellae]|uniref:DUF3604 domain-containing protein n=1 Tax=Lutimaribacter marinistellae TaxID=1820329 RepID=A0ABV7TNM0_9RHOB